MVENNNTPISETEENGIKDGLYVNREKIEEFLFYENKKTLKVALAFGIFMVVQHLRF